MAIASVAANASAMSTMQSEALEKRTVNGRDTKNDGDSDDRGGSNAVKPTVNTQGQPIGTLLNTQA